MAALAAVVVIVATLGAVLYEVRASRPIGEGQLFAVESAETATTVQAVDAEHGALDMVVRRTRNDLQIEAVSVVGRDGTVVASTSPSLVGAPPDNSVVAFGLSQGRFAAAAMPLTRPIELDGVEEWGPGDAIYVVGRPLDDGRSLLLHYDVAELLARRSRGRGIEPPTLILLGLAVLAAAFAALLEIGRTRAASRISVIERETTLLRAHGVELEQRNIELDAARLAAEEALALAEEKNRIRSEFVLMINHELRTPLTSVLTGARLLSEIELPAHERAAILDDMLRDGARLEEMISQILAVARIENRGLASTIRDIDVRNVWASISGVVAPDIVGDHPPGHDLVATDPATLAAMIASLVDNARQHGASSVRVMAQDSPLEGEVTSVGDVDDPGLRISIVDDGPGIDPDFMPRVFEKFEKDSFSSGTGLGLYVVRLMADAINASVAVTSSSQGTHFQIILPRALHVTAQEVSA